MSVATTFRPFAKNKAAQLAPMILVPIIATLLIALLIGIRPQEVAIQREGNLGLLRHSRAFENNLWRLIGNGCLFG